jgi:hypothetical protein
MTWRDDLLGRFGWYRRWRGGRWEGWYLDFPVVGVCWFRNPDWAWNDGRPPLGRGTPRVETYDHDR